MPVAAVDAPDRYDFWARGVWGEVSDRMVDAIGRLGALPTHGDPGLEAASDAARQSAPALRPADAVPAQGRPQDDRQPRCLSRRATTAFPRRLAGLAAMLAAGLPLRVVALSAPGRLRHARQPGAGSRRRPQAHRRLAARVPARSRGSRARRSRPRARLDGVRPPREGERLGRHRPRRRRHRAS